MAENIKVSDPTSTEKTPEGYAPSDVEHLFRVREWKDWDEVIGWLRQSGDDDNEFTPGEVRSMVADFDRLRGQGQQFPNSPDKLYDMARRGS